MADDAPGRVGPLLMGDRPLPHSQPAEAAVLSCVLQDPAGTMDLVFGRLETDECLYVPVHRRLFACLRQMRGELPPTQIDFTTIADRLERQGVLTEIGGEDVLRRLYNAVPTSANAETYVGLVLDCYIMRRMIRSCADIMSRCYAAEDDIPELIDNIEQEVLAITELRTVTQHRSLKELLLPAANYLEALSKRDPTIVGLPTGYVYLDKILTGFKPGELIILAARPAMGKTTLALNMVMHAAVQRAAPVVFFSLEMSALQVTTRLICSEAQIDIHDVRDGKLTNSQWSTNLFSACERLKPLPLFIDDTPQLSSLELRQKARRLQVEKEIKLVAVDYLQLMRPVGGNKNTNREQEVAKISRELKALARELQVPVIVLAQLNRAAEQSGGMPKLSNLRESGAIEQDADVVLILHRERDTDSDEVREIVKRGDPLEAKVIVAKNRNGPTGIVDLDFYPQYTLFKTKARVDSGDIPQP